MIVYNKDKTKILEKYDLTKGHIEEDIMIVHHPEVKEIIEEGHYEIIREYPNGGKDVEWIVDVKGVDYSPEREEAKNILIYIPYTESELQKIEADNLRRQREIECFSVINRGGLWYKRLSDKQMQELELWYQSWLDVTLSKEIPERPVWLK